jgi:HAE1 family hydrophobic/amphiphilic exporter-1
MLMGIIVNNGIVLIDYINQARARGKEKRQAIIEASTVRIRPVLMTALTTVLGLLPMAFAAGEGAEMIQPVAVVCIGGLIYATLMTLFIIPVMYDILGRVKKKK